MASTEVATQQSADIEALLAQQNAEFDALPNTLQVPILKVAQQGTKEVKQGDSEPGDFVSTLTGESMGTSVDFIVAFFQAGRSVSDRDEGYKNSIGTDTIPDTDFWKKVLGPEFVGTRWDEHPDAEEQYKIRVNDGDIKWGKGPLISTTYNYTGLVIPSQIEGDDEEADPMVSRITFLRSTKSAHDKLRNLKNGTFRNQPFWDYVFALSTSVKTFGSNDSYIVNVKKGRKTTPDEKTMAVELAMAVAQGRTADNSSVVGADVKVEPDAAGGLKV